MKAFTFFIVSSICFFSISCENNTVPAPRVIIYKGVLVLGHEASSFSPCADTVNFWVNDYISSDSTHQLQDAYNKIVGENAEPYTQVYAELKGTVLHKAQDGFANDYDSLFNVTEIVKMEPLNVEKQCSPFLKK